MEAGSQEPEAGTAREYPLNRRLSFRFTCDPDRLYVAVAAALDNTLDAVGLQLREGNS